MGNGQSPNALDRIHAVANPGIAVVAMNGVSCARRKESAERVLPLQDHGFNGAVQVLQLGQLLLVIPGNRMGQNHGLAFDRT